MLSVIMLSVIMLSVILLNIVTLSVVAPLGCHSQERLENFLSRRWTILQLEGQNLDQIFNFGIGYLGVKHLCCYEAKLPSLELKTRLKQLSCYFLLDIELPLLLRSGCLSTTVIAIF